MSRNIQGNDDNVVPVQANGTVPAAAPEAFGSKGYVLLAGQTYFAKLGGTDSDSITAHVRWDAAIIITSIAVEDSDFIGGPVAGGDVPDINDTPGNWIKEDASPPVQAQVVGAGATVTGKTVAVAGGAGGGAMFHVQQTGARRTRLRIVVGGTGGSVRIGTHGKE